LPNLHDWLDRSIPATAQEIPQIKEVRVLSRIFLNLRRQNIDQKDAAFYALSCVVGKFAQLGGAIRFLQSWLLGTKRVLVEYKNG